MERTDIIIRNGCVATNQLIMTFEQTWKSEILSPSETLDHLFGPALGQSVPGLHTQVRLSELS